MPHLRWLANLLAYDLPLIVFIVLDRLQQSSTLSTPLANVFVRRSRGEANEVADLVFGKLRIMHVLGSEHSQHTLFSHLQSIGHGDDDDNQTHFVPMLLDTPLRPRGECLCNLAPTASRFPQRLEPLLFRRRPRRIGSPFLRHRRTRKRLL